VYDALEKLQNAAYGPYQIGKVLRQLCNHEEYFGNAEDHGEMVNEIGLFQIMGKKAINVDKLFQNNGNGTSWRMQIFSAGVVLGPIIISVISNSGEFYGLNKIPAIWE